MTRKQRKLTGVLEQSLKDDSALRPFLLPGMQALGAYSSRVSEADRQVTDSIDFDEATRSRAPDQPRWDYFLGIASSRRSAQTHARGEAGGEIIGIEVHPASDKDASTVIAKKAASSQAFQHELRDGPRVTRWVWIASGRYRVSPNSAQVRNLAKNRIELVGRQLRL